MDNRRFVLLCAFGVVMFFMYQAWQKDFAAPMPTSQPYSATPPSAADAAAADAPATPSVSDLPQAGAAANTPAASRENVSATPPAETAGSRRVSVSTDKLRVQLSTRGGDIRRVELLGIPISKAQPDSSLPLMDDRVPNFFQLQSGLVATEGEAPNHHSEFVAETQKVTLPEGANSVDVRLRWQDGAGRTVTKVYTFHRGRYDIDLRHEVENASSSEWKLSDYVRLWRHPFTAAEEPPFIQSFMGVGLYERRESGDYRFRKIDFSEIEEAPLGPLQQQGGWLAMLQHYFLAAVIPAEEAINSYSAKPLGVPGYPDLPAYRADSVGPLVSIAPGERHSFASRLYIGPKLQDQLGDVAPGLELTVDYGVLTILAEPLFSVLAWIHSFVGNWGWAIIILTLFIKGAFYKLSEHQYRAMARMRKFAPRIQSLKERYADDREGMQKAMMDLYKKEGFNPLGGCWPMLVQIPVFIALYWVLLESVELRQASWMLWINDLSSPDPYWILPICFGVSMFFQQRLSMSTATMDEMQRKMIMAMPVVLTVFFGFFPAGLVLYWLVSNLVGIAQQWLIYRKLDAEGLGHKS